VIDMSLPGTHPLGFTADHRTPLSRGGTNALNNLLPAHQRCNNKRGNSPISAAVTAESSEIEER
jgi:5-methylcytosine-specific restriction endonuclease McrA